MKKICLFLLLTTVCIAENKANNITVNNLTLTGQNATNNTYQVQFDISWENSWRTSTFESNYDAAWVFVKFKARTQANWSHGVLNLTGFVAPTGSTVEISPDARGAAIYRSANGIGNTSFTGVQLQLNYGTTITDADRVEICVYAIEMVHVNQGAFYAGDASSTGTLRQISQGSTVNPFQLTAENSLTLGGTALTSIGTRNNTSDDFDNVTLQTLSAAFPKGFNGFYCMKYEISMQQYCDFLNKLTAAQALARFPNQNGLTGHTIANTGSAPDLYITSTPDRACNYLSWSDLCAYADWSGLRPMTELEYEKACRGIDAPLVDECAWGLSTGCGAVNTDLLANAGLPNEAATGLCIANGNFNNRFTNTSGANVAARPLRCGFFAASATNKTREETGATFWGIMEMGGNVEEQVIGIGTAAQRTFTGLHGNGSLAASGDCDIANLSLAEYSKKGGTFDGSVGINTYRVSDRSRINSTDGNTLRSSTRGGRLVRTTF
ncbi:MAG: SUMF1/EgtB/PvdO family nonheme iron enzyme [Ferruginibacter sp.]